jgi:hypothetical protein
MPNTINAVAQGLSLGFLYFEGHIKADYNVIVESLTPKFISIKEGPCLNTRILNISSKPIGSQTI